MATMPPNANRKNGDQYITDLDALVYRRLREGFNPRQIAARMGIGITVVRASLARVKEKYNFGEDDRVEQR